MIQQGKIIRFHPERGIGTVIGSRDNHPYFFHVSCLRNRRAWEHVNLTVGEEVTFEPIYINVPDRDDLAINIQRQSN